MKLNKGFTLVELMIVISIIAVLAATGLAIYTKVSQNARDARRQTDLRSIQSALEQYNSDQFFYPATLPAGGQPFINLAKTYLNSVPADPIASNRQYLFIPSGSRITIANCDNSTSTKCISYCLYANMENSSNGNKGAISAPSNCPFTVGVLTTYNFAVTLP